MSRPDRKRFVDSSEGAACGRITPVESNDSLLSVVRGSESDGVYNDSDRRCFVWTSRAGRGRCGYRRPT